MSRRNLLLLAIAVVVLVLVLPSLMKPKAKTAETDTGMVAVVAKRDIAPYTVLQIEDLDTLYVPKEMILDTFGSPQEAVGAMITTELRRNNLLLRKDVLELDPSWTKGSMLIFSFNVPTANIVGGKLRPGHHIDVLASLSRGESAESLWLARNLWVVGVYQTSGAEVARPTPATAGYSAAVVAKAQPAAGGGLFGGGAATAGGADERVREGPANLVLVAADRDTSRLIGYYLDAMSYSPWVFVRPEPGDQDGQVAGRVDGVVYADYERPGERDADEPGIEGATIKLYDATGKQVGQDTRTDAKGNFGFSGLGPGVYTVEELDPTGYAATTPSRLTVYLAEGQNRYVEFGARPPTPPKTPTPLPAIEKVPPQPTATPPTPAPTPVPTQTQPATACACTLYLSEKELGLEKAGAWSDKTAAIWVMFGFDNCPDNIQYKLALTYAPLKGQSQQINLGSGTWKQGDKTKSIRIPLAEGQQWHPAGSYVVTMEATTPDGKVVCASPRSVSADVPPTGAGALPSTGSPVTSFGF